MSTAVNPESQQPNPTPAPTSPSPAAPGTAPSAPSAEYRYPDDPSVPVYARGKTASELLGITTQTMHTLEQFVTKGQPPAQPAQPAYQPPATQPGIPDGDYMTGADFNRLAPQIAQQYFQPQLRQTWESVAQTNLELVKRDPGFAPIFQKYGPEVWNKLANVDKSLWNVDNLKTVVNLVKADHVDELASEIASQRISEMQPTFRSTGAAPAPVSSNQPDFSLKSEKLPEDYRKRVAETGLTEAAFREFLRANDMTEEQWFAGFAKTAITEGGRV